MISAVFDANVLVSAFFSRHNPGGVSSELLRLAREGTVQLHLSPEIVAEILSTLVENQRTQERYRYTPHMAAAFCDDLRTAATMVVDPPPIPGSVPRDPDDEKIIACAAAASVQCIVTRDRDLLTLGSFRGIAIVTPEAFRQQLRDEAQAH